MHFKRMILAALTAAVLAGCGGGSDEDQVREVASDFTAAFADSDAKRACELMTSEAKQQIVKAAAALGGGECEKTMSAATGLLDESQKDALRDAEITKVTISGDRAEVTQSADVGDSGDGPMQLAKRGDRWLVDADEGAGAQQPSKDWSEIEAEEEAPAETPKTTVALGEKLVLNGYEVTLTSAEPADELPGPTTPEGKFIILNLEIRNTGPAAVIYDASSVGLVDADGTAYRPNRGGAQSQYDTLPGALDEIKLEPGSTETGKIAFDLPVEADITSAQFASTLDRHSEDFSGIVTLK